MKSRGILSRHPLHVMILPSGGANEFVSHTTVTMRALVGLMWAMGGAVAGFVLGALVGMAVAMAMSMPGREGERDYFIFAMGLVGAVIGLIAGLVLYARSAPSGQAVAYVSSGTVGLLSIAAALALSLWAFTALREAPLQYGGSMATLVMEFRVLTTALPADSSGQWLNVEVQTANTRPVGTVLWTKRRTEGLYTVIPVEQDPLSRAANRLIVVRISGLHDETFNPPMKRTPDPKADWSAWYEPTAVDAAYGVVPTAPLTPMLELRYRVRPYAEMD